MSVDRQHVGIHQVLEALAQQSIRSGLMSKPKWMVCWLMIDPWLWRWRWARHDRVLSWSFSGIVLHMKEQEHFAWSLNNVAVCVCVCGQIGVVEDLLPYRLAILEYILGTGIPSNISQVDWGYFKLPLEFYQEFSQRALSAAKQCWTVPWAGKEKQCFGKRSKTSCGDRFRKLLVYQ